MGKTWIHFNEPKKKWEIKYGSLIKANNTQNVGKQQ